MVLDVVVRGLLEKQIDIVIDTIPYFMSRFRKKELKDTLQFKDEEDFMYGMAYGGIVFGFSQIVKSLLGRKPTDEETLEVQTIIVKRMREVKDKIFKTG
jgi:hypothetical protein